MADKPDIDDARWQDELSKGTGRHKHWLKTELLRWLGYVSEKTDSVDGRADGVDVDIADVVARVDGHDGNIADLDDRIDGVDGSLTTLDGRLDTVESYLDAGDLRAIRIRYITGEVDSVSFASNGAFRHLSTHLGFYGAAAVTKPNVTGSRSLGTALTNLLLALESLGIITDSTTAL